MSFNTLVTDTQKEYLHKVGSQCDNAILEMEKLAERISQ